MQKTKLKGYVKTLIINTTRVLKDEDFQRRIWFRREGPEVSSYIDTGVFFVANTKQILDDPENEEYLGKETYALLKKLYDLLIEHIDRTEDRIDPYLLTEEELLNDPKWQDIQTLAGNVEEKFKEFLERYDDEQKHSTN